MKSLQLSIFEFLKNVCGTSNRTLARSRKPRHTQNIEAAELKRTWVALRERYFPNMPEIDEYSVQWSGRRQKRTLASCNMRQKRVLVAKELNHPEHLLWLEPLLYHEMCHAVLGNKVETHGRRRAWHGKKFRELESRHRGVAALNRWIREGGWKRAVRSERARLAHQSRLRK